VGYLEQKHGADDKARELYRKALEHDPGSIDAATNLGVLEAKQRHLAEAVKLWQSAFERAPGRSEIGMNLARAFCAAAQYEAARTYTRRVLQFNPDRGSAKKLLAALNETPPRCVQ
jgi:Flp pilus assembly protein TadD